MRKGAGIVLSVVGAFLLVAGLLATFYAQDRVMKTPLDVDTTTRLSGTAELANGEGEGSTDSFDVRATSITHSDTSRSDDDVISFDTSSCLFKDDPTFEGDCPDTQSGDVLTASTDTFATDRKTAEAVNEPKYLPSGSTEHEGLVNKWPFEAEKKDYPYWEGTLDKAIDAVYDRTEKINGHETYVYKTTVSDEAIEISDGVPGTYSLDGELAIDPTTGSIIRQEFHQERIDADGNPFLILDLAYTDAQVEKNVDEAKSNGRSLNILTDLVPILGFAVGLPLLLIGIVLLVLAYRRPAGARTEG